MDLQQLLKIISHKSKFKIVMHLMKGEECVCDIAKDLDMEQSLVSHHIDDLRKAGIIQNREIGTWVHCSLNKEAFGKLEKLFLKKLGYKNISNKMCSIHELCRCLSEELERTIV